MREALDIILTFIGAATLTDEEFDSFTVTLSSTAVEVYEELLALLDERDTVTTTRDRLKYYFLAKGVDVPNIEVEPASNILVGGAL